MPTSISQSTKISSASTLTAIGAAMSGDSKINIYIVNQTASTGTFRLAIDPAEPSTGGEYLYYDFPLASKGTFIAADVYVKATDKVWVYSPANWSARVDGATLA